MPNGGRTVIDVQRLLGLPDSTPNPHLWYDPATMPRVADAIAAALSAIQPSHAAYFTASAAAFAASLKPLDAAIASFKAANPGARVAVTEPVADYLLSALGAGNLTPWTFQADIMNGVDPSPQDVAAQRALFTGHKVTAFLYNQQVTDGASVTGQMITRGTAEINGVAAPAVTSVFAGDRIATEKAGGASLSFPSGNSIMMPN